MKVSLRSKENSNRERNFMEFVYETNTKEKLGAPFDSVDINFKPDSILGRRKAPTVGAIKYDYLSSQKEDTFKKYSGEITPSNSEASELEVETTMIKSEE